MTEGRRPLVTLVAAMDHRRVIGCDGRLPWRLPADLRRFRAVTWGKPIIMGRKTHESIGRPLPGRTNIVLTRDEEGEFAGCLVAHSVAQALELAGDVDEVMVVGGSGVFAQCLPQADGFHLTVVHGELEGDTRFPPFDLGDWRIEAAEHFAADADNAWAQSVFVLVRRARVDGEQGAGESEYLPDQLRAHGASAHVLET